MLLCRCPTSGLVPKAEAAYKQTVVRLLSAMRRAGGLPFEWLVDNTRRLQEPYTLNSMEEAVLDLVGTYRRALWTDRPETVYVFVEKDALSAELAEVTDKYDVPLGVVRGDASISFLHSVATRLEDDGRPAFVYYFGDHDPNGVDIDRVIERDLRGWAPSVDLTFERVAVKAWQIEAWNLPTRPTKTTDTRAKKFKGASVELDTIPPDDLRVLVRGCIERHLDANTWQ